MTDLSELLERAVESAYGTTLGDTVTLSKSAWVALANAIAVYAPPQPAGLRVKGLTDAFGAWLAANATPAQIDSYNAYYQRVIAPEVDALEPQQEEAVAWPLGTALKEAEAYIGEYELDDGEVHHVPSEVERLLMLDMINGLFSEDGFVSTLRKAFAHPTPVQKQESQTVSEGHKLVPIEPTPRIVAAVFTQTQEPTPEDMAIALQALAILPSAPIPKIVEALADIARDYRALVSAAALEPSHDIS